MLCAHYRRWRRSGVLTVGPVMSGSSLPFCANSLQGSGGRGRSNANRCGGSFNDTTRGFLTVTDGRRSMA